MFEGIARAGGYSEFSGMHGDLSGQGTDTWNGGDSDFYPGNQANGGDGYEEGKTWDDLWYPKAATTGGNDGFFRDGGGGCLEEGNAEGHSKDGGNTSDNPINPPLEAFDKHGSDTYQEINTWESGGPNTQFVNDNFGTGGGGRENNSINKVASELAEYMLANADGFDDADGANPIGTTVGTKRGSNGCKTEALHCTLDLGKKTM